MRHAVRMKPLPFPLRVVAGLAMTVAENARELPKSLVGLPVTVASQLLQFTMRLQQQVTELAIKGDEALSALRPVEEAPSWATFDEDLPPVESASAGNNGHSRATAVRDVADRGRDPWEDEERALAENHNEGEFDSGSAGNGGPKTGRGARAVAEPAAGVADTATATERGEAGRTPAADEGSQGPACEPAYDGLTLPQLRARLRRFTLDELEELLAYERAHEDRPSFVGMLARRITNVRRAAEGDEPSGA